MSVSGGNERFKMWAMKSEIMLHKWTTKQTKKSNTGWPWTDYSIWFSFSVHSITQKEGFFILKSMSSFKIHRNITEKESKVWWEEWASTWSSQ